MHCECIRNAHWQHLKMDIKFTRVIAGHSIIYLSLTQRRKMCADDWKIRVINKESDYRQIANQLRRYNRQLYHKSKAFFSKSILFSPLQRMPRV